MLDNLFGNRRASEDKGSKEAQQAHYQRLRQQLESGQLDGKPRQKHWLLSVLGVLLIVAAFALGVVSFMQYTKLKSGNDWPAITATLTATSISSSWNERRKNYDYAIGGIYTYAVNGSTYEYHTTVDSYTSRLGAENNLRRLIGQHMTLYYDPSHPHVALPFPGVAALTFVLVIVAALALVFGIFFFMTGGQPLRKR
jgi:Protein of unknown function (DUF3592)